jgi:hypothetical protein
MNYDAFMDALASGKHPPYGLMVWDGNSKLTSFTVRFQDKPDDAPDLVRRRAVKYFARLRPNEWALFRIEITLREGLPVRATITPREGAAQVVKLGTGRLQELAEE